MTPHLQSQAPLAPSHPAAKPSPLRVLVADDHAIVRRGLKQILEHEFGAVQIGEAACGREAIQQAARQPWDAVLLDISMPGLTGFQVLKQIKALQPHTRVLVISMYPEDQYAIRVLRAGAQGYIPKDAAADLVGEAMRKVLAGGTYVSDRLADELVRHCDARSSSPVQKALSDREFEILTLLGSGKSIKEIAFDLGLSIKTVSTYRARLVAKLGLSSTASVIHYCIRQGLVDGVTTPESSPKIQTESQESAI